MNYLDKYSYTNKEIKDIERNIPDTFLKKLEESSSLVCQNLDYLNTLGVTNLKEVFRNYYDMFLMDNASFVDIFNKYETEDLVQKLEKNVAIIEYL